MSKLLRAKALRYRTIQTPLALKLPFPMTSQMRLALLSETAPVFGLLTPFRPASSSHLEGFRPNLIAGTVADFEQLADEVKRGFVDLSCLDHAVIVLTRCGNAPLSDVARVVFWQAFGVPVYEVFTGLDDSIMGYECELHEGWHMAPRVRLAEQNGELMLEAAGVAGLHTGLSGVVTTEECPCGRRGRRVLNLEPVERLNRALGGAAIA